MDSHPDYRIEAASTTDLNAVMEIETRCFNTEAFSRRQMSYLITKAKGVFYVLKYQEKISAYISLITNSFTKHARIYSIAVDPDARGAGFGQSLLDKAMDYAREHNCHVVSLEVNTSNTAAIRLYKKNGFTITGVYTNYYPDGANAYKMASPLV